MRTGETSITGGRPLAAVKLLLTVPEAAKALGVGRSLVYELLITGKLASVKIGRARRVPVSALELFVSRLAAKNIE
jgi:excisionase family DNA binding protein